MDEQLPPEALTPASAPVLYRLHLARLVAELDRVTVGMRPGINRLLTGIETYWDACFSRRDVLRAMTAATAGDRATQAAMRRQGRAFVYLLRSELIGMGCTDAGVRAWELLGRVRKVAVLERRHGRIGTEARAEVLRWASELGQPLRLSGLPPSRYARLRQAANPALRAA
ncbi:MAG TPA: hypothetical protein VFV11_06325 [Solimonas sp.]|nr:hypothetical protein [Solimonas sp.]